jgi:acid phosphatase
MKLSSLLFLSGLLSTAASASEKDFNIFHHLSGNSRWFPTPSISGLDINTIPANCKVTKAIYTSRHVSRFSDPKAYNEWTTFHQKLQNATFTAHGELAFLKDWKPVVEYPIEQLAQLSIVGWGELFDSGMSQVVST